MEREEQKMLQKIILPDPNGNNKYQIQARWKDCGWGSSGRIYESLQHKIIVSFQNPLKIKQLRMKNVGFCGVTELYGLQVIEELSFRKKYNQHFQNRALKIIKIKSKLR